MKEKEKNHVEKNKEEWNAQEELKNRASTLFDRAPIPEYLDDWTNRLKQKETTYEMKEPLSVLVFRIGEEWLALPTICFHEVTHRKKVHRIPHRSNKILAGVVNLNGRLQLYVALHQLLDIASASSSHSTHIPYLQDRLIAISDEGALWVFPVDEIDGIYLWDLTYLENLSTTVSQTSINYIKGILRMETKSVGLLDKDLLFSGLKRSIQ